jgi:transposase
VAALELAGHLSAEELGERYRAARDRVARGHLQVVWLLAEGRGGREVARVVGLSERWVAEIVRRYNEGGPERLGDRRRGNAGAKPLLDAAQRGGLAQALRGARRRRGACGAAPRWRRGSPGRPGARSARSVAGTT